MVKQAGISSVPETFGKKKKKSQQSKHIKRISIQGYTVLRKLSLADQTSYVQSNETQLDSMQISTAHPACSPPQTHTILPAMHPKETHPKPAQHSLTPAPDARTKRLAPSTATATAPGPRTRILLVVLRLFHSCARRPLRDCACGGSCLRAGGLRRGVGFDGGGRRCGLCLGLGLGCCGAGGVLLSL